VGYSNGILPGVATVGRPFKDETDGEYHAFKEVTNEKTTWEFDTNRALGGFTGPTAYPMVGWNIINGIPNYYVYRGVPAWIILEQFPHITSGSYTHHYFEVTQHGGIPPIWPIEQLETVYRHPSLSHDVLINADVFDTNFSAWFVITDLLQFRKLALSLFGKESNLRRLHAMSSRDKKATAKQLADDHLAISFGVIPTVADLQSLYSILLRWKEVYSKNNEVLHKRYTWRGKQYDVDGLLPPQTRGTLAGVIEGNLACTLQYEDTHTLRHSRSMQYFFTCPEFSGYMARLRQFVDAFGLLDPSALWDVIPFSFVVDWFVHVGSWVRRNRPILFPADVWITYYLESLRLSSKRDWYMTWYAPREEVIPPGEVPYKVTTKWISTSRTSSYIRRRFQPPKVDTRPRTPRTANQFLTLRKIALSASLLNQRLAVHPRRERTRWHSR
jgi:hypothetical protein